MANSLKPNVLHSFKWSDDPSLTFSVQCPDCAKWIECREPEEGECACGSKFRIAYDLAPDWTMKQHGRCTDCGAAHGYQELRPGKRNSWLGVKTHQTICGECAVKAESTR